MKKITFFGRVFERGGKWVIEMDNREDAAQMVMEAMGGASNLRIVFYEDEKEREKWINSYYWAYVLPTIHNGIIEMGNEWEKDETHNFLKGMFTPKGTTKNLTTNEYRLYIEKCCKFAAELLGVVVPPHSTKHDRFNGLAEPPQI